MLRKNIYIKFLKKSFAVIDDKHKRQSYGIGLLILLNSIIEVLGLVYIVPVLYLVNNPAPIHDNQTLNSIYVWLNFENEIVFVLFLLIMLVLVFIVKNTFSTWIFYKQKSFTFSIALDLIERQSKAFLRKNYLDAVEKNSNYSLRNIAIYPEEFATYILMPLIVISSELSVILLITIGLLIFNIKLFILLCLTLLPLSILIIKKTKKKAYEIGVLKNEYRPKSFKQVFETIYSFININLSELQPYFVRRIIQAFKRLHDVTIKEQLFQVLPQKIMETIVVLAIVILYSFIVLVFNRSLSDLILVLILFATASYRVMPSIDRILRALIQMKSNQYVFEELEVAANDYLEKEFETIESFERNISFENILFKYPSSNKIILNNISLKLEKGQTIGVVGESGVGKTSLVNIIAGLVRPSSGMIVIDDKEVTFETKWNKLIGYVNQNPYILDASLIENIAFGIQKDKIDHLRVREIVRLLYLDDFVSTLNNGLDEPLGEFGVKISGGQRQRIAIARALYSAAPILILDEALNALDNNSEGQLLEAIYSHFKELTIIIVAHNKASIKDCDRIIKVIEGEIFEVKNKGLF